MLGNHKGGGAPLHPLQPARPRAPEGQLLPTAAHTWLCTEVTQWVRTPVPVLLGAENPKPWDATLPPPELKVPAGFCSPNEEPAKLPNVLAPLFPNRLEVPEGAKGVREGGQRENTRLLLVYLSGQSGQNPRLGIREKGVRDERVWGGGKWTPLICLRLGGTIPQAQAGCGRAPLQKPVRLSARGASRAAPPRLVSPASEVVFARLPTKTTFKLSRARGDDIRANPRPVCRPQPGLPGECVF